MTNKKSVLSETDGLMAVYQESKDKFQSWKEVAKQLDGMDFMLAGAVLLLLSFAMPLVGILAVGYGLYQLIVTKKEPDTQLDLPLTDE